MQRDAGGWGPHAARSIQEAILEAVAPSGVLEGEQELSECGVQTAGEEAVPRPRGLSGGAPLQPVT